MLLMLERNYSSLLHFENQDLLFFACRQLIANSIAIESDALNCRNG